MRSITEESKSATVKYDDLEMAYSFVSDTYEIDAAAYVCRKTGKIFWESTELDDEFEVPDDIGDSRLYAMGWLDSFRSFSVFRPLAASRAKASSSLFIHNLLILPQL
jgi:hypothetical protein